MLWLVNTEEPFGLLVVAESQGFLNAFGLNHCRQGEKIDLDQQ